MIQEVAAAEAAGCQIEASLDENTTEESRAVEDNDIGTVGIDWTRECDNEEEVGDLSDQPQDENDNEGGVKPKKKRKKPSNTEKNIKSWRSWSNCKSHGILL